MSDKETQLIHGQVAEDQLEETIKQRFGDLPLDEGHFSFPLFQDKNHAILHSALPSLSSQEVIEMQIKSRFFRWVNRGPHGRIIGIEINKDYANGFLKEIQSLEKTKQGTEANLLRMNNTMDQIKVLRQATKKENDIKQIDALIKKCNSHILDFEKYLSLLDKKLQIMNKMLGQSKQTLAKGDNFIAITTVPEDVSFDSKKVTLTYSFPSNFKRDSVTGDNPHPLLMERIRQSLDNNPYINFVEIDEEKEGVKASIQIVQTSKLTLHEEGAIEEGHTTAINALNARPISIVLSPGPYLSKSMKTFLHELAHALGAPHPWDAIAVKNEAGKFKGKLRELSDLIPNKDLIAEDKIEGFRKKWKTPFAQTLVDSFNEAYGTIRENYSQDIRAVTGAFLSVLYHVEDPYPQGVTFKFRPEKVKPSDQGTIIGKTTFPFTLENLKKKEFYSVDIQDQADGSKRVTYEGRCTGITLSNPGDDFTDLDFRAIPAFPKPISGFPSGLQEQMVYGNGVTAYLGPDANITFYTRCPSINDFHGMHPLEFKYIIADKSPSDKNVSIDLLTRNLRRIYLSGHNDSVVISKFYKNVEVYPGAGNDMVRVLGNNTTIFVDRNEGQDSFNFERGGTVKLNYKQDELKYYQKGDDVYLIFLQTDATKKVHGVCLKNYMKSNYADSVTVQDSAKKTIGLKNKKFATLPDTINFGS